MELVLSATLALISFFPALIYKFDVLSLYLLYRFMIGCDAANFVKSSTSTCSSSSFTFKSNVSPTILNIRLFTGAGVKTSSLKYDGGDIGNGGAFVIGSVFLSTFVTFSFALLINTLLSRAPLTALAKLNAR